MENTEIFKVVGSIAGIGGIGLYIFYLLIKNLISKMNYPILNKKQAYNVIRVCL